MLSLRWTKLPWAGGAGLSQIFKKNKREFLRVRSHNLVKYHYLSSRGPTERVSNIINLSEGGLQFRYRGRITVGTAVKMLINIVEEGKQIPVLGRVKWIGRAEGRSRSVRVGVSFMAIEDEDKNFIRRFIRHHKKEFLFK